MSTPLPTDWTDRKQVERWVTQEWGYGIDYQGAITAVMRIAREFQSRLTIADMADQRHRKELLRAFKALDRYGDPLAQELVEHLNDYELAKFDTDES